jgi:Kef-type K+ transport system membrane component KefB
MSSQFFFALFCFIAIPTVISRVFKIHRIFPLVFLQLLFGFIIHMSGLDVWLQARNLDLMTGPLAYSLNGLGWLGVSLLIAMVAAEAAPTGTQKQRWRFVPISVAGFAFTCAIGSVVGLLLVEIYPSLKGTRASDTVFALAVGISLSVTALPVLAAILRETGLVGSVLGNLATNCAILDDVWLWLGMAAILSLAATSGHPFAIIAWLLVYLSVMFLLVRPLLHRWINISERNVSERMLVSISLICLSAVASDLIGLHAILGAFVAGAILPKDALTGWRDSLMLFSQTLLLPFFFILTGMRLQIDIHDQSFWLLTFVVTVAAISAKLLSVTLTARATGLPWRESIALGSLMQCKGLMELVAINILLDSGIIGPQIFSALATMALISTFITAPILQLILGRGFAAKVSAST